MILEVFVCWFYALNMCFGTYKVSHQAVLCVDSELTDTSHLHLIICICGSTGIHLLEALLCSEQIHGILLYFIVIFMVQIAQYVISYESLLFLMYVVCTFSLFAGRRSSVSAYVGLDILL